MTDTDCDLWDDLLASPRSFADLDGAQLDALASHVDACARCRARAASTPPQADMFALLARDVTGHTYDAEFEQDVEYLLAAQQSDTVTAVTDVLYPAFRGTSGAAQMDQVRAALASHSQPELALWRAIDAVALLVRRFVHQERPPRQWLRSDGGVDLGDGNEIPTTTLAAEMARSAGISVTTAHLIVTWLPDAVRRIPTLFRGLEAEPTPADESQPPMALQLVDRDNLESLLVRWQPAPTDTDVKTEAYEVRSLLDTLRLRASTLAARPSPSVSADPDANALEEFLATQHLSLDQTAPVMMAVTLVGSQMLDSIDTAAQRRVFIAKIHAVKPAVENVARTLTVDILSRHEQSGDHEQAGDR